MLRRTNGEDASKARQIMHKPEIHPDVVRRATERRGGLRVFNSLMSKRTAHIVVDLQNGFMAPGQVAEIPAAREIVPNVNRISAAVRAAGGLVVYIQNTFDAVAVARGQPSSSISARRNAGSA